MIEQGNVNISTLATAAGQTDGSQKTQLYDSTGTEVFQKLADGMPRVIAQQYLEEIAEGNITGHTPWSKIGYNPAVTTSEEDLWSAGGTYVFPSAATIMEVLSSSAAADEDVGTILFDATCDAGGTTTTLLDAGVDFTATAAAGDYLIIEKSGTTPEWGIITAVANGSLTFANGLSSGGSCATARTYQVLDSSASKGAMAVKIDYLDANYAAKTEIIILNANNAVDSINQMFRINSFRVIAAGSKATATNAAIGNLTLRADAAGTTYSYITAGFTRARNNMYTVPAGKTLYVNMWQVGAATPNDTKVQTVRVFTKVNREPSTGFGDGIFYTYTELLVTNEVVSIEFPIPTKLVAKTDIKVAAIGLTGFSGPVTSILRGWLE